MQTPFGLTSTAPAGATPADWDGFLQTIFSGSVEVINAAKGRTGTIRDGYAASGFPYPAQSAEPAAAAGGGVVLLVLVAVAVVFLVLK